jgi:hypothetical protein
LQNGIAAKQPLNAVVKDPQKVDEAEA